MTAQVRVRVRRGLRANLPADAPLGELLLATDTGELFSGRGVGVAIEAVRIDVAAVVGLLNGGGKIKTELLPSIAITQTHVVADIAARDALDVPEGDVAVVVDASDDPEVASGRASYIYDGAAWHRLSSNTVSSVNGQTGDVALDSDDVPEGSVNLYHTTGRVQAVINADSALVRSGDNATRLGSGAQPAGRLLTTDGDGNTLWTDVVDGGLF